MAGWLFADLFLVLLVASLASLQTPRQPKPPHAVRPAVTHPVSLDRPVSFILNVQPAEWQDPGTIAAGKAALLSELNSDLAGRHLTGRQAGVLLVFASGPETGINQAIATAQAVIGVVRVRVPGFSAVTGQGYWNGDGSGFKFEIFFFSAASA
jgi:hypothetical protein